MRTVTINDRVFTWQDEKLITMEYKPTIRNNDTTTNILTNMLYQRIFEKMFDSTRKE